MGCHHEALLVVTVAFHHIDALSDSVFRKYLFRYLVAVFCNQRIGGIYYGLRGAVVLLEFECGEIGIGIPQVEYVSDIGSAERVYALSVVTDHA
jgi:hypothetical protein